MNKRKRMVDVRTRVRIGSRSSPLAVRQAHQLGQQISAVYPGCSIEYVTLKTTGDLLYQHRLSPFGGKGLFTKELEEGLLANTIDVAIHSLKDMAVKLPDGLVIGAILPREDPRDAFVSPDVTSFYNLPRYAVVGTSSLRREAFSKYHRPDLRIVPFRGNVETRLRKMSEGEAQGTFLAVAGLKRLGLTASIQEILEPEVMLPAVAQGCLAVECRENDENMLTLLASIHDLKTCFEVKAERAFLRELDGSCRTPVAALATTEGDALYLRGAVIRPDGLELVAEEIRGSVSDHLELGQEIGRKIKTNIGSRFLKDFRIGAVS